MTQSGPKLCQEAVQGRPFYGRSCGLGFALYVCLVFPLCYAPMPVHVYIYTHISHTHTYIYIYIFKEVLRAMSVHINVISTYT